MALRPALKTVQRARLTGTATVSVALVLAACCVHGQSAAPAPVQVPASRAAASPAQPPTSIAVNADEVSLDLQVHDKKNRLVTNLEPSQISVVDDGKPVKLTSLRLVTDQPPNGQKIALVFNMLNSAGQKNARNVAASILKAVPPGFSFAVLNVGSRLRLLQTYTQDRAAVSKAVEMATELDRPGVAGTNVEPEKNLISVVQTGADLSGNAVPAAERALAKILLSSIAESQRIVQDRGSQPPLAALVALSRAERDIVGRKVVIYFTEGLQTDSNSSDMVRDVVGAANRSGVTIYAVDLNALDAQSSNSMMASMAMGGAGEGLRSTANATPTEFSTPDTTPKGMEVSGADQAGRLEADQAATGGTPLGSMAVQTGGAYIVASDSLKKPLKRMVEDMTTYYEASFTPASTEFDGSFRTVLVTSPRKDVVLRYPAGYFALAPGSGTAVRPFEAPLLKMLAEPQLPNDLQFRAGVLRMGNLQDGDTTTIVVEAPLDNLDIREDSNTKLYSLHVSIVAQIKDKSGTVIDHFSEDVPRHGALESLDTTKSDVITLQRHFVAPPGEYVLEAAVLDQNSDKAGAQRIKFDIPAASAGPAISDIALVRRTDPVRVGADPTEPLRYGKAKVVPNLSGEITKDAKDISVFFILHPDAGTAPMKLEMEVSKDGKSIGKMPLPVPPGAGAGVAVPYLGTIQARSLSPGNYEVTAVLAQGDKTVQRNINFSIGETEVASATVPSGSGPGALNAKDSEPVSDSSLPGIAAAQASKLVITSPADPIPPPTPEAIATILAGARARALHYSESLPNFSCVEVTTRSVDPSGRGAWKHEDQIAELLKYRDEAEARTMLEVNGKPSKIAPEKLQGMTSRGQFGGVLNEIFSASTKADFHWKETDILGTGMAQVFSYSVEQKNSDYGLTGDNHAMINVAFHGLVYIDAETLGVRRITMEADGIPRGFSIHASSIAVDYDYIVINNHDYLMPVHAAISIRQRRHEGVLNELDFRDYRRFGSRVRILGFTRPPTP